ncbi:hypothetical protein B0T26DRAFT_752828 [Lasiosphaeria miniovina]|uniref:Uncharacterized protein n=1 Tax=Lasiosphaeria miniovina TaxID=1954250 RepID=A0AA40DTC2_9PEZI|nr:uncharacterized protein B0T26DRAFT_752828 [Lasiosphaeria miniovina]KAK0712612.1 hypothetical protein B0T26DRAFT_752828 [Lasiosphaeria miniovina]
MAALVATFPRLPAFDQALNTHDFQESRALYNSLKDDADQPYVDDTHIQNLAALFVRHNAENVFGNPDMRWAKPTDSNKLEGSSIHGHIFVLTDSGFRAYEFQDGPLPDLTAVDENFLAEFSGYIVAKNLTGLIGLQVLGHEGCSNRSMSELILDERSGTVMLDTSLVKNCRLARVTGWTFETVNGQPRVYQANETHTAMVKGNHKVFNAGKPHPKLENVDDLKAALFRAGVI